MSKANKMEKLINYLSSLNEETTVIRMTKDGISETSIRNLLEVVNYGEGSLVKNFSLLSGRILAGGRLYKVCL